MKPNTTTKLLKLSLASYRLAVLFAKDDGPLDVFLSLRDAIARGQLRNQRYQRIGKSHHVSVTKQYKYWKSLYQMIRCPFCLGVWFAFFVPLFPDWLIDALAIAGMGHIFLRATE